MSVIRSYTLMVNTEYNLELPFCVHFKILGLIVFCLQVVESSA